MYVFCAFLGMITGDREQSESTLRGVIWSTTISVARYRGRRALYVRITWVFGGT